MAENSSGEALVIQRVRPREPGRLTLVSEAIGLDGRIGDAYSAYHDDMSPPLMWTGMPDAETYALIVEDPDAPTERPFLHWVIWNIPGKLEGLPANIPKAARLSRPEGLAGAVQGLNGRGQSGYMGPRPPEGGGLHRYHFQLFALDIRLDLSPEASLEELVQVLKGNTIASCELIGTYGRDSLGDLPSEGRTGSYGLERRTFTKAEINAGRTGLDEDDVDRHAPHDPDGVVRPGGAGR
ncbi:MAG: YbhB/YbcL family Raf kinase inhibitor-like protein [Caulobacteraceae bacterium]